VENKSLVNLFYCLNNSVVISTYSYKVVVSLNI
jgi:hypothetical protein